MSVVLKQMRRVHFSRTIRPFHAKEENEQLFSASRIWNAPWRQLVCKEDCCFGGISEWEQGKRVTSWSRRSSLCTMKSGPPTASSWNDSYSIETKALLPTWSIVMARWSWESVSAYSATP